MRGKKREKGIQMRGGVKERESNRKEEGMRRREKGKMEKREIEEYI